MSRAYVDSSAIVGLLFGEPGGRDVERTLRSREAVYSSPLLEAEVRGAAAREGLDGSATEPLLAAIRWVVPERRLTAEIDAALAAGRLRGADLHHVACALYLAGRPANLPFITLDAAQGRVAGRLGFPDGLHEDG